jgi:hypothetical protein
MMSHIEFIGAVPLRGSGYGYHILKREYEGRDKIHENTESGAYVVFLMPAMMSTSALDSSEYDRVLSRSVE